MKLEKFLNKGVVLKPYCWYRIGGPAAFFLDVDEPEKLAELLDRILSKGIVSPEETVYLGEASNVLVNDAGFPGLVVRTARSLTSIKIYQVLENYFKKCFQEALKGASSEDELEKYIVVVEEGDDEAVVRIDASLDLQDVIGWGLKHRLGGMSWAGGLPGTIGAAMRGNVGAFGGEFKDVVVAATIYQRAGRDGRSTSELRAAALKFKYRSSIIKQEGSLVLSVKIKLKKLSSGEDLQREYEDILKKIAYRRARHPLEYPNIGSVFKNITARSDDSNPVNKILQKAPELAESVKNKWYGKIPAGVLIEKAGLKGYLRGGAQISIKHANYIVNKGGARSDDVCWLIRLVQDKVWEKFAVHLEPEITLLGY